MVDESESESVCALCRALGNSIHKNMLFLARPPLPLRARLRARLDRSHRRPSIALQPKALEPRGQHIEVRHSGRLRSGGCRCCCGGGSSSAFAHSHLERSYCLHEHTTTPASTTTTTRPLRLLWRQRSEPSFTFSSFFAHPHLQTSKRPLQLLSQLMKQHIRCTHSACRPQPIEAAHKSVDRGGRQALSRGAFG